jgi:outer membrane protein assembly factor BamB
MRTPHSILYLSLAFAPATAWADIVCPVGTRLEEQAVGSQHQQWCAFADGTRHGPSLRMNSTGDLLERGHWKMGLRDGAWTRYDKDGTRIASGNYAKGERTGTWQHTEPDTGWTLARDFSSFTAPEEPLTPTDIDGWLWWSLELPEPPIRMLPIEDALLIYFADRVSIVELISGAPLFEIPLQDLPKLDLLVEDGRVAFLTEDGAVSIADLETHQMLQMMASDKVTGIIAMEDDVVVTRDRTGSVSAVDVLQGRRLWVSSGPWGRVGPVYLSGTLVGVQDRYIREIVPQTGETGWKTRLDERLVELVPGFEGDRLYALDRQGGLYALDLETGKRLWVNDQAVENKVAKGALLRDDLSALIVFNGSEILRIDHDTGERIDRLEVAPELVGQADLLDQLLCVQSVDTGIECTDIGGAYAWALETPSRDQAPVVLDRLILSVQDDHRLLAIDRLGARLGGDLDSDIELSFGEVSLVLSPEWEGDEEDGFWFGRTAVAEWVMMHDRAGECGERSVYLDLVPHGAESLEGTPILIQNLMLESPDLDGALEPMGDWEIDEVVEDWELDLLVPWGPTILEMEPYEADPELDDEIRSILACEQRELTLSGMVRVQDGLVQRRYDGRLGLTVVDDLDADQGCLIELTAGGEDLGIWSDPKGSGRMWLRLIGAGDLPYGALEDLFDGASVSGSELGSHTLELWAGEHALYTTVPIRPDWELGWRDGELGLWGMDSDDGWTPLGVMGTDDSEFLVEGLLLWDLDVIGEVPSVDKKGLVPLLEISSCDEGEKTQ